MIKLRSEWRGVKVGTRCYRLTVLGDQFRIRNKQNKVRWSCVCLCDCGTPGVFTAYQIEHREVQSCGCRKRETDRENCDQTRHGESHTRLHNTWLNIRKKCHRPTSDNERKYYHDRGIRVCDEWNESYEAFRDWALENGYDPKLTIERIDNDLGYCPENCTFATRYEQSNNRRYVHRIEAFGEVKTISQWANDPRCSVSFRTLRARLIEHKPKNIEACITRARWEV